MVFHMKTTLNIDDSVMQRLRDEAGRRGTAMSALLEAGLRYAFARRAPIDDQPQAMPPLPKWRSGGFRIDISDKEDLYRLMYEEK